MTLFREHRRIIGASIKTAPRLLQQNDGGSNYQLGSWVIGLSKQVH
jgi:hypothetical protein